MRQFAIVKVVLLVALLTLALSAPGLADRLPAAGTPGQPLISGDLSTADAHGVIHCQAAVDLLIDPNAAPGSAPGGIVVTPNGYVLGAPREGTCAELYTAFTGQQP